MSARPHLARGSDRRAAWDDWMKEWRDCGEEYRRGPWQHALLESDLDKTAKYVGLTLAVYMNSAGLCYPGKQTLAEGTGLDIRTVDRAITRLLATDWLLLLDQGGGHEISNIYAALMPLEYPGAPAGVDGDRSDQPEQYPGAGDGSRDSNPGAGDGYPGAGDAIPRHPCPPKLNFKENFKGERSTSSRAGLPEATPAHRREEEEEEEAQQARAAKAEEARTADQAAKEITHRPGLKEWLLTEGARLAEDPAAFRPALDGYFGRPVSPAMAEMFREYALLNRQKREEDA